MAELVVSRRQGSIFQRPENKEENRCPASVIEQSRFGRAEQCPRTLTYGWWCKIVVVVPQGRVFRLIGTEQN